MRVHTEGRSAYARKWKAKRLIVRIVVLIAVLATIVVSVVLISKSLEMDLEKGIPRRLALEYWKNAKYEPLLQGVNAELGRRPLDAFYLSLKGFASFQLAMSSIDGDQRLAYIETSIKSLRSALLFDRNPYEPEIFYVLGKAYFRTGMPYMDLSIGYLKKALAAGVKHRDIPEYLALAAFQLDMYDESIEYFDIALKGDANDTLSMAAAQANLKGGRLDRAIALLTDVMAKTRDVVIESKARAILCEILLGQGRIEEAEKQALDILETGAMNADGHFYMGMVHQARGDPVRARAEWRKAVQADPGHAKARQKLSE